MGSGEKLGNSIKSSSEDITACCWHEYILWREVGSRLQRCHVLKVFVMHTTCPQREVGLAQVEDMVRDHKLAAVEAALL